MKAGSYHAYDSGDEDGEAGDERDPGHVVESSWERACYCEEGIDAFAEPRGQPLVRRLTAVLRQRTSTQHRAYLSV